MSGRRRWALACLAGSAVLAAGVIGPLPAATAQDETTHVDTRLGYLCPFPSGEQLVEVHLVAGFPAAVTAGEPVGPSGLAIALTVPQAALADLTAMGAASVSAVVRVGVTITHGESAAAANWSATQISRTGLPAEGDLGIELDPPDAVPAVVGTAGTTGFHAAEASIALTGYLPDGAVTDPPSLELSCPLAPGQDTAIAAVKVSEKDSPAGTATEEPPPGAIRVDRPPPRAAAGDPAAAAEVIPEDCEIIEPPEWPTPAVQRYCANITGYTNLAKLNTSVLQPVSLVNIAPTGLTHNDVVRCVPDVTGVNIRCQAANILPNLAGEPVLAPSEGVWTLPFGFVPTKASMQLTQLGLSVAEIGLDLSTTDESRSRSFARVTAEYEARVYDASVNGVPFDLGPDCRTAEPIVVELRGRPGRGSDRYTLTDGGLLVGSITIPPFTGCGAAENVDPLLTGLISGSGNFTKMVQGAICTLTGAQRGCPPVEPEPQR